MKTINLFFTFSLLILPFTGCNERSTDHQDNSDTVLADDAATDEVLTLKAKFVDFTLGDAEHYSFEDENGKTWDFGGCEDTSVQFAEELPAEQANESNQGWAANKQLQNQWFELKYVIRQQPLYIDGPVGEVAVILEARMVQ